jgi:hypothetical protein
LLNTWSRQAWLQAMQVLISSARPRPPWHEVGVGQQRPGHRDQVGLAGGQDLLGQLGVLIRLEAHTGTDTSALSRGGHRPPGAWRDLGDDRRYAGLVPADAGVEDGDAGVLEPVGELDHLVPGLAVLDEVEQRDPVDDREARGTSSVTASRPRRGNRIRRSAVPPQWSVRSLVRAARNWLIRYPSEPMISTPSYPALRASATDRANAVAVSSTPLVDSALGRNGVIGDFFADAAAPNGW